MMAQFTFSLAVVILAVCLETGVSGFAGISWSQLGSGRSGFGHVGFSEGKCSAMKGILPDPKSGCCGRHAETDGPNPGGDDTGTDGDNEEDDGNDYGGIGGGSDDDEDYGKGNGYGPGNGIGDDDDSSGGDYGNGNGYGPGGRGDSGFPGWDMGNGIGDDMDFGGNRWSFTNEHRLKRSADKNASDIAPDKFITAGKPTGIAQYPWLVHLNVKVQEMFESKMIGCGGSLISSRHVITAAHCLDFQIRNYEDVSVFLAEYNTRSFPTDCVGRQCIKNVVMHPDKLQIHSGYQRGMLFNDIGMMRLRGSAPFTDYIRPICLPSFDINNGKNAGTTLTITGWGQTERGEPSSVKLHTQVHLVAPNTCKRHYQELTNGQLCAAGMNGQDTCMGDSGGPIMVEREGTFFLVGLVSGKRADAGCGSPVPTLYTNVFAYRKWIENFMRN